MIDSLLSNPSRVQMSGLNGYVNGYSEKLARNNQDDPSNILIDK